MTIKKPVLVELYMEHTCPICRALIYNVFERLEIEGHIKLDRIDVNSTRGTKKWRKWKRYCNMLGYDATPIVMMGPFIFMTWKTREKPESITEGVMSSFEIFELQLKQKIKELDKYVDIKYRSSYERDTLLSIQPEITTEVPDAGVYIEPKTWL